MTQRFQHQFRALGSAAQYTLVGSLTQEAAQALFAALQAQTEAFERRFSRFRDDSELTRVNNHAGETVAISPEFHELLQTSKHMAQQTGGLYNPFVLPALQRSGYVGSWPEPEASSAVIDFRGREPVPIGALELGKDWVRLPADSALDFGGIGKGYLLDELAASLADANLDGFWLSLGGDIILEGQDINDQPWRIGVQSAFDPTKAATTVTCGPARQAIATSGITKRRGTHEGKTWHHIIDPRTNQPADTKFLTATVVASSAQYADVYAKCVLIGGTELAERYQQKGIITSYYLQQANEPHVISSNSQEVQHAH